MGIATAMAIGGLVVSAASTAASAAQASKQRKLQSQAETDAANAMAEAKKNLGKNFYDTMGVKKEPYELQREAMLAQGAEAIQAGVESERGAAATAGKVQGAMNVGQADIRTAMGTEMTDIEKLKLQEDARLRDVGVQLNLEEVAGQQQMAADAQAAKVAANQQMMQGVTSMVQQGLAMAPLYEGSSAKSQARAQMNSAGITTGKAAVGAVQRPSTIGAVAGAKNPFALSEKTAPKLELNPFIVTR